jgi:transposase
LVPLFPLLTPLGACRSGCRRGSRLSGLRRGRLIEAKPQNLIGDRAYDSGPLDEELRQDGIAMIAPHRANRTKPPTQDRRRLSRYMRRWLVERFFAWIQWQRRILVRWSSTHRTSSVLSNSPASSSSSGDFEIGSSKGEFIATSLASRVQVHNDQSSLGPTLRGSTGGA